MRCAWVCAGACGVEKLKGIGASSGLCSWWSDRAERSRDSLFDVTDRSPSSRVLFIRDLARLSRLTRPT
eukprot:4358866-Prymnesium_polylepis.1